MKEKQRSLYHQTTVLAFFKSLSETRTSPPVLLDIAHDDPYDLPTFQEIFVS